MDTLYSNLYLIGRLFFAVILYLSIRVRKPRQDFELSFPLWRLMLLLTLSPLGIMISLILLRSPYMRIGETILSDSALFLLVILSFAVLLRALTVLEKQQRLEQENMLALQNQRYYKTMEQQQFETRKLRHDLSNHLQILLALPEDQKDAYIKEMLARPAFGQILTWCGDTTINIVLTVKEELMRQNNILFLAKVDIKDELPFDRSDLCAIFANALDNAVEACVALTEGEREIHLDAAAQKGVLAVNIRNSCQSVSVTKDFPKTTKKNAKNHGLGLRSIQETVNKYDGNMEIKQKKNSFNLFLYLPIPVTP
ncbi:MAG: ATP-binding protein [Lachnospiraceae bacterium]|nr:ATP-binding protein [Lachnospiraceae bacterium]